MFIILLLLFYLFFYGRCPKLFEGLIIPLSVCGPPLPHTSCNYRDKLFNLLCYVWITKFGYVDLDLSD